MRELRRLAVVLTLLIVPRAAAQNAVTEWNSIAITEARKSNAPGSATPGGAGIYVAYMQLAVYNAVNAIDGRFEPYKYSLRIGARTTSHWRGPWCSSTLGGWCVG
jgi:hypothetical protein